MKRVIPWLLTFIVCIPNILSSVEIVNALTQDKKEQTKISDVKFSKDAIHSKEKIDLSFKIEKPKESPLERTYSIPKNIERTLIPTKSKYVIKQKKKDVGEVYFKKGKMIVQWKQKTAQQKIKTDCTLELTAHYYNDEEEINKVKIGKEVINILPAIEPLEDENLLIQDIHYQPLKRKQENQVVLDLKWPTIAELKKGTQYVFKLPKWMDAKKCEIFFKDEDKKNWFEAKIEKERVTLKILKGKVYDPTIYRLPIVFRVNANQNEKVVEWMKHAIPLQKKSVAMDEIDTAIVDTTKETEEVHKQSLTSESSSSHEKIRSISLTSDSTDDATSTTSTDIQNAIILSHQEVKEGATEQEEIKIRTIEELLQKSPRIRQFTSKRIRRAVLDASNIINSISADKGSYTDGERAKITVDFSADNKNEIHNGDEVVLKIHNQAGVATFTPYSTTFALHEDGDPHKPEMADVIVSSNEIRIRFKNIQLLNHIGGEFHFSGIVRNFTNQTREIPITCGSTKGLLTVEGLKDSGGKNPFYYKSGQLRTNNPHRIQWWLNGNTTKEYLYDNVYIKDEVQSGHILDPDSIKIYFTSGPLQGEQFTAKQFQELGYGTVTVRDFRHFEVVINQNVLVDSCWYLQNGNFVITYDTIITNDDVKTFDNHSQIYYRTPTYDGGWQEADASVKNIYYGGTIHGDRDLVIQKVDDKDHAKGLKDARFILTHECGHDFLLEDVETDANGQIIFRNLPDGKYTLVEANPPKGYDKLNKKITFYFSRRYGVSNLKPVSNQIILKDKQTIMITNKEKASSGATLPNTGGDGYETWFILVTFIFVLGTIILYIYKKKGTYIQ